MKPTKKTIELTIKFPFAFKVPLIPSLVRRYKAASNKKKRPIKILALLFSICLVILIVVTTVSQRVAIVTEKSGTIVGKKYTGKLITTPDYTTVLPAGKTIADLGGWTRVSPPQSNPVFAYVDTINGKQINVSEQPLPAEFKQDTTAQVQQLASGYKATDKVTVGTTTVFIGTSAKGPQSVIFVKNNLLILVKSSVAISDDEWAGYVNSLK